MGGVSLLQNSCRSVKEGSTKISELTLFVSELDMK